MSILNYLIVGGCVLTMGLVCVYGLHRYHLVYLYYRYAGRVPRVGQRFAQLPRVTVQLPMFNELYVAERVIEQACAIDYPRDRLQIQVLDDSTDETCAVARAVVERMQAAGCDIEYVHRADRTGYKAGALENGLRTATGEFVAIFDADFVPDPLILRDTIHHFTDARVGMVQARWEHINRAHSLLTQVQAVLLDGHFVMEHGARSRSDRFMSFNGTAGVWRKSCIVDAGGWQHDTLTEDLDLSYRAQLRGWRFLFVAQSASPAELPPEMSSFKSQQHRWAKGGAQTCRKLLPTLLRARLPVHVKIEAFFHLTSCLVYVYMMVLVLLLFPAWIVSVAHQPGNYRHGAWWLLDLGLFLVATCSASTFYVCSQRELLRSWWSSIKYLPALMSLGVGICLNNARATLEGLFGGSSEFVRTPKYGVSGSTSSWQHRHAYRGAAERARWRRRLLERIQPWLEVGMGLYMIAALAFCIHHSRWTVGLPFMALFAFGFLYIGGNSLIQARR